MRVFVRVSYPRPDFAERGDEPSSNPHLLTTMLRNFTGFGRVVLRPYIFLNEVDVHSKNPWVRWLQGSSTPSSTAFSKMNPLFLLRYTLSKQSTKSFRPTDTSWVVDCSVGPFHSSFRYENQTIPGNTRCSLAYGGPHHFVRTRLKKNTFNTWNTVRAKKEVEILGIK